MISNQYHEFNLDGDAFNEAHQDDLWVFDKLILSKKLGYVCGGKGVDVPFPGRYIVRPCVNFMGMGAGAKIMRIERQTDYIMPDGSFWCAIFGGAHLSVDYFHNRQRLCVMGLMDKNSTLTRWAKWEITDDHKMPFPEILKQLAGDYEWINVEFVGPKVIEVHLRRNPDFEGHDSPYIIPVWNGDEINPQTRQRYIHRLDLPRIGFYIEDVL